MLHWSDWFLMAEVKRSWQHWHSSVVEKLWKTLLLKADCNYVDPQMLTPDVFGFQTTNVYICLLGKCFLLTEMRSIKCRENSVGVKKNYVIALTKKTLRWALHTFLRRMIVSEYKIAYYLVVFRKQTVPTGNELLLRFSITRVVRDNPMDTFITNQSRFPWCFKSSSDLLSQISFVTSDRGRIQNTLSLLFCRRHQIYCNNISQAIKSKSLKTTYVFICNAIRRFNASIFDLISGWSEITSL